MNKEEQMKFHEMQANWWMHSATNGHAGTRTITRNGHVLTADELRDNAMQTSRRHMQLFMEVAEKWGGER